VVPENSKLPTEYQRAPPQIFRSNTIAPVLRVAHSRLETKNAGFKSLSFVMGLATQSANPTRRFWSMAPPPSPDQPSKRGLKVPTSLKSRAADLERLVNERAEIVKRVLRDYRETARASAATAKGSTGPRDRARLNRKRTIVERANAEYIQLQKELETLRSRMLARK
jgi:hypothetical protein